MNAKRDWIKEYSPEVKRFQMGGAMAPPAAAPQEGAPAPAQGGGADLEGMIAEYAQSRDPQLAVAICDAIVELMAQGGGAPAEGGAPMAKKGMKIGKKGPVFKKKGCK